MTSCARRCSRASPAPAGRGESGRGGPSPSASASAAAPPPAPAPVAAAPRDHRPGLPAAEAPAEAQAASERPTAPPPASSPSSHSAMAGRAGAHAASPRPRPPARPAPPLGVRPRRDGDAEASAPRAPHECLSTQWVAAAHRSRNGTTRGRGVRCTHIVAAASDTAVAAMAAVLSRKAMLAASGEHQASACVRPDEPSPSYTSCRASPLSSTDSHQDIPGKRPGCTPS